MAIFNDEQAHLISFEHMLKFGDKFINSCLWINGGAIVAILAFIGSVINHPAKEHVVSRLCLASVFFIVGLICAVLSYGLAYLSQEKVTHMTHPILEKRTDGVAKKT